MSPNKNRNRGSTAHNKTAVSQNARRDNRMTLAPPGVYALLRRKDGQGEDYGDDQEAAG